MRNSSGIKSYRSIWHKLRATYGIAVNRDEVNNIVHDINPQESENRKGRKLK